MALEITLTGSADYPYKVTRLCRTWPEAQAVINAIGPLDAEAFIPSAKQLHDDALARALACDRQAPELAVEAGEPATGGGESSQAPLVEALQERAEADDPQVGALKAGEAYDAHPGAGGVA